jgi:amino acid adenylation domain-containing protein
MQAKIIRGFQLSPQQKRLWQLQKYSSAYFTQFSLFIEGTLQLEILKAALQKNINRQEIYRTNFRCLSGKKTPVMVVEDRIDPLWQDIDLSHWNERQQLDQIEEIFQKKREQYFDLERGALLHCYSLKLSVNKHFLLVFLPALCADTQTIHNLVKEISILYSELLKGEELCYEENMQYLQVSEWQNQLLEDEEASAANEYWCQQKLSALETLKLPLEKKPLKLSEFSLGSVREKIAPEVTAKIASLAQKYDTSLQEVLLVCWQILIWRLTGEPNIILGWKSDRREYEELQNVQGLLATWLPIKSHLSPDLRFFEVLELARSAITDAQEWQDYFVPEPIDNEKTLAFPLGFEFEQWPKKHFAADVSFSLDQLYCCIEPFKVKLTCTQRNDVLEAEFYYDVNFFSVEVIQRLARQFQTLLTSTIANPNAAISQLEILSASDRQQLLFEFNQTQVDYPLDKCIHQVFEEQVEKTPDNIAIVFEDQQLTYAELNARANQLAHYLQDLGVSPEILVGIYLERSLEMIVALLGILKAGGAYLPLDPALPRESLALRLQDAQATVLLTKQHWVDDLPTHAVRVICLGSDWEVIARKSNENPTSEVRSENLVYVIYTSGSTGRPKGVAIEHQQLLNYLNAIADKLDLPTDASFATVSTFAADLGNTAIFPALCRGGCLHVLSKERASDPETLAAYFDRHPIDCLKIVPSHLAALLGSSQSGRVLPRQRLVLGGEAASWHLIEQIQQYAPTCRIFNHYGPTEATVGVLTYPLKKGQADHYSETVPLGRPLANTQVYVLNQQLQPVPIGVPGELYIGGAGLARGYLNSPELTAAKFRSNPWSDKPRAKLYKTGDRVRYLSDGNLEFLGRIDNQVKIRGFRIELGEIESVLKQHPEVREVVVLDREEELGVKSLVAYVVPRQGNIFSASELRRFLKEKLPEYMMPSAFVPLKNLPLTPNGKVDRQALPSPDMARPDLEDTFVAPQTPIEESLARIWAEVLRLEKVGVHDNFFDLGGHSLLVTQVVSRLRDTFEVELPLSKFFEAPNVADLAVIITQRLAEETDSEMLAKTFAELEQLSEEEVQALLASEKQSINQEGSRT